jgi:hypothetical protein
MWRRNNTDIKKLQFTNAVNRDWEYGFELHPKTLPQYLHNLFHNHGHYTGKSI